MSLLACFMYTALYGFGAFADEDFLSPLISLRCIFHFAGGLVNLIAACSFYLVEFDGDAGGVFSFHS